MRLSCSDNTFRLLQPWERAVELIRMLDLDAVDVCVMGNRSHIRPEDVPGRVDETARRITAGLGERGLAVSDLFVIPWTDFETLAPNHPASGERARSRAFFADVLGLAVAIGAPGITLLPGVDWPDEGHDASFDRAVAELAWRAGEARSAGVRFSVEPHVGSVVQDPAEAARLVGLAPDVELTLDHSHFVFQGYAEDAIEQLLPHARHLHVRGARRGRLQTPLRESTIDYERLVDGLAARGYDGDLGLEVLWIDWEHLNECDTLSETILLRDRLRARIAGRPWRYPESTI